MKTLLKFYISIFFLTLSFTRNTCFAQSDTLRIYYQGYNTKMLDSNEAKIGNWAKNLNGKHVNVDVLCYYYEAEHKKEATERSEELWLILNRKARELITIKSNSPKKGEKFQRTRVDIVYSFADAAHTALTENKTENKESKKKEDAKNKTSKSEKKSKEKEIEKEKDTDKKEDKNKEKEGKKDKNDKKDETVKKKKEEKKDKKKSKDSRTDNEMKDSLNPTTSI